MLRATVSKHYQPPPAIPSAVASSLLRAYGKTLAAALCYAHLERVTQRGEKPLLFGAVRD